MIIEVVTGDGNFLERRYESDCVPVIGDRLVFGNFGYRVTDRTWRMDTDIVELWTEKE